MFQVAKEDGISAALWMVGEIKEAQIKGGFGSARQVTSLAPALSVCWYVPA